MELRYRLAVVIDAGGGLGREVAVALGRSGAAVLCVDPDPAAAETTAALVRTSRVGAWSLQVDLAEEVEVSMLAARARDLGGMDLLVVTAGAPVQLTRLFLDGLAERRGRPDGTPAAVLVARGAEAVPPLVEPAAASGARVMAVRSSGQVPPAEVARAVVDLLRHGTCGQVVELAGEPGG